MLAYKDCLPCPLADPLDTAADVTIKVVDEKRKGPRRGTSPLPKAVGEAASAAVAAPPVTPRELPETHAAAAPRPTAMRAAPASNRNRNLMIALVVAALAFAGSQYYFRFAATQLSDEDVTQQHNSNVQMVKMNATRYFQSHNKKYPTSPQDINSALNELHMTLTSPYTNQPIKVVGSAAEGNPGDVVYQSDGKGYKIRIAGPDKQPWAPNGKEFVVTDAP